MRAREWKKAIQDEKARLDGAAEAEEKHGQAQLKMAMEKAKSYRQTADSLERILEADKDPAETEEDEGDDIETAKARLDPDNELVGEGDKAF